MSQSAALAEPPAPPLPANDARDVAVLRELTELALNMARRVEARCAAAPNEPAGPDLTEAMDRIGRTIRRTIALRRRIEEAPPPRPTPPANPNPIDIRKRILRESEDLIGRRRRPAQETENLLDELNERLDDPDLDADIATRPVEDIIAEICRDLGVATGPGVNYWARRTPADLAALRARAATATDQPAAADPGDSKISRPFGPPRSLSP